MVVKKPWESKTIIVSAIMAILTALSMFVPNLHVVGDWISANGGVVSTVWAVLAIVLRLISKGAISLSD